MKRDPMTMVLLSILIISALRVVSTYAVFSQTYDEGAHIAAGMEWLRLGTYDGEPQHPPLARVAAAIGPWLAGAGPTPGLPLPEQGNEILHSGPYTKMLSLARLGILPFFLLSIVIVWSYARRLGGGAAAIAASVLYANQPTVLAHAGLATTDMALTAGFVWSLFLLHRWLLEPSRGRAALFGLALAVAVTSKFSAVLFIGVASVVTIGLMLSTRRTIRIEARMIALHLLIALAVFGAAVWGVYRFSFEPLRGKHYVLVEVFLRDTPFHKTFAPRLDDVPLAAPELVSGVAEMLLHNRLGHASYLLGEHRMGGWWYYFPIAIAVKTTVLFLLASFAGFVILLRQSLRDRDWQRVVPFASAVALIVVSMPVNVNIGVRHMLPAYPLLAISAGCAVAILCRGTRRTRVILVSLFLIELVVSFRAHPDHLPYFNFFAGDEPRRVLIDSNLDWGQDLLRLSRRSEELGIEELRLSYFGTADLERHDLPELLPVPWKELPGWFAVSVGNLGSPTTPVTFPWLDRYEPVERIGKSIRLYRIPDPEAWKEARENLEIGERLIVPLPLGTTKGAAGTTWVSQLELENRGRERVELRDGKGWAVTLAPALRTTLGLTSTTPSRILYVHSGDAAQLSGWVRVRSYVGGAPRDDLVVVPVPHDRSFSQEPIRLNIPGCDDCRRTVRVYDLWPESMGLAMTIRSASGAWTREIPMTRAEDPNTVAAAAQVDLSALFPEIPASEQNTITISGGEDDRHRIWAFVTVIEPDTHRVILPD